MIDKREFGDKIRSIREQKGMSRQKICQMEEVLSIRQLQRIEKGESIPSISTALYLAKQLGVTVASLVDVEQLEPPKEYYDLMYRIRKIHHYGSSEKLIQREKYLEKIYDCYFDFLPEEEKLAVQIEHALIDITVTRNIEFDQGLVDEYLERALLKDELEINDVDIIYLKLYIIAFRGFDNNEFIDLLSHILTKPLCIPLEELFVVQSVVISCIGILCYYDEYGLLVGLLKFLEELIREIGDMSGKPYVYMTKWKIDLFIDLDLDSAYQNYKAAIELTKLLSNNLLHDYVLDEWKEDEIKFKRMAKNQEINE